MAKPIHGRNSKGDKRVLRRSGRGREMHCMSIPVDGHTLLLPTSVMEEVLEYQQPEPMEGAPDWLLGQLEWDGRQVPVFSFDALINGSDVGDVPGKARIMILKSLAESGRVPYLGLLLSDLPRPVNIKEKELRETGDEKKSLGVFSRVRHEDEDAIVPDLDRLTHLVTHATFGALPITQLDE